MSRPRWQTVLFDLDGTLVNTIPLILASYDHAIAQVLGERRDERFVRSLIGRSLRDSCVALDPQRHEELYATYLRWNEANTERLLARFDGVEDLLADLAEAGVQTGVVTSKRVESANAAMSLAGLAGQVPLLATMADTDRHKPEPDPLLHGMEQVGGTAARSVYVGDAVVDVMAARAAGMASIAVTWGAGYPEDLMDAGPDVLCESMAQLRSVLLG